MGREITPGKWTDVTNVKHTLRQWDIHSADSLLVGQLPADLDRRSFFFSE